MEPTPATISRHGEPIVTNVDVTILHGSALVHSEEWTGDFVLPEGAFVALGGPYDLTLADGRRARILLTAVRPDEGGRVVVEFSGVGPFPQKP